MKKKKKLLKAKGWREGGEERERGKGQGSREGDGDGEWEEV